MKYFILVLLAAISLSALACGLQAPFGNNEDTESAEADTPSRVATTPTPSAKSAPYSSFLAPVAPKSAEASNSGQSKNSETVPDIGEPNAEPTPSIGSESPMQAATTTPAPESTPEPPRTVTSTYTPPADSQPCENAPYNGVWLETASGSSAIVVGEEVTVHICAAPLPTGMAGFDMTFSVVNSGVASVLSSSMPDFGLTSVNESTEGQTVLLKAVDINNVVPDDSDSALLAAIHLKGRSRGDTLLSVSARALDDNYGNSIDSEAEALMLSVRTP